MAQVGLTYIGTSPAMGPSASIIITQEYPAQPYGVYLFTLCFTGNNQPNSRTQFVHSFTGLGLNWTHVSTVNANALSLINFAIATYIAFGTPARGPVVAEIHERIGFPSVIEDAGPSSVTYTYGFYRVKNVALDAAVPADVVIQSGSVAVGASGVAQPFLAAPSDARNIILATSLSSQSVAPVAGWPFVQIWNVNDYAAFAGPAERSITWYGAGGTRAAQFLELGYHKVPWLRQKQRDDF